MGQHGLRPSHPVDTTRQKSQGQGAMHGIAAGRQSIDLLMHDGRRIDFGVAAHQFENLACDWSGIESFPAIPGKIALPYIIDIKATAGHKTLCQIKCHGSRAAHPVACEQAQKSPTDAR